MLSHNWFWEQKHTFFLDLERYLSFFPAQFLIEGQPLKSRMVVALLCSREKLCNLVIC